jgi:homocysteine S-methyltransferase
VAVGVNCCDPGDVADAVGAAVTSSGRPAVAYPNSGESWDAEQRRWSGDPTFTPGQVGTWLAAGARLVGGCCRVRLDAIAGIRAAAGPGVR